MTGHIEDDVASSYNVDRKDDESSSSDVFQQYLGRRKILSNYLSQLHDQYKVIKLANYFVYRYNIKMAEVNKQEIKVSPNEKWYLGYSVPLCNIFSISASAPLCFV